MSNLQAQQVDQSSQPPGALKHTNLKLIEGVAIIVGADVGAGILSLAFGARNAGFPVLLFWIILAGTLTTISMLYIAETSLRTKKSLQLSGLAEKYVGKVGSWIMFLSVLTNSLGALIAYTAGSGNILAEFFNIPPSLGSIIFFIPAVVVIWFGLKATGVAENIIIFGMAGLVLILVIASFLAPQFEGKFLIYSDVRFAIPIFSLTIFAFLAQYTVPELARGYSSKENVKNLPRAIIIGMVISGIFMAVIPMAALGLTGPDNVTEVVTVAWADALGSWAFFTANGFALLAMLTSFWAIGGSFLTNIVDQFKFPSEWDKKYRFLSLSFVAVPPFVIAYSGVIGFVDAISIAGAFAGVVMAILPVMMINKARKVNEKEPEWTCGRLAHPAIQATLIILFTGAAVYTFLGLLDVLPKGW
ncbi:aromatic amino acid transport family protein (plasmid) [Rossellomorea sp. FS2]|uniref:aromatic amino acid transport family protein n=1 Tax=Rossellomorea sp. FS2 TaxID=3391447 RepID=UPI003A4D783A